MPRRLGVIIGVNQYHDSTFRPLQYAENDARALGQWLVNAQGGKWDPDSVQLLQGVYATREQVETLITQACIQTAGPGDLVLVYFAGHAFLNESTGDGYLALATTRYQQPETGIHLFSLAQQTMGRSRASTILFMLDCFQSGPAWGPRRSSPYDSKPLLDPGLLNALQQANGRMIFCSCRGNELAPEAGERNLGLFIHRTIVGLCGSASDPTTGQVTLPRLHTFLFSALGERHRPQLFGQEQSPLVLVGEMAVPQVFQASPSLAAPTPQRAQPAGTGPLLTQVASPAAATKQMSPATAKAPEASAQEQQRQQQIAMYLRQARHLVQMNNPVEALNCVEQVLQLAPTDISALILKGQLLGTTRRFAEALLVVDIVLHLDEANALAWSMRAALLTNMGQYQDALEAVEHSLELDPNNPETYSIRTSITENIARVQSNGRLEAIGQKRGGPRSFLLGMALQFLGLLLCAVGGALPLLPFNLPTGFAFALASLGLASLCVNAARGSFVYGFTRLLLTLLFSLIAAGIAGAALFFEYTRVTSHQLHFRDVINHEQLLVPLLFLLIWLALAAIAPLLLAIGGLIGGAVLGVRRRGR